MGVGAVLFVVGVPILIRLLGAERYGIWVLITTVTGWLGFSDFGLRTAIVRAAAVANSTEDPDASREAERTVGHATVIYLAVAGVLLLLAVGGTPYLVSHILAVPNRLVPDAVFVVRLGVLAFTADLISYGLLRGIIDGAGWVAKANVWSTGHLVLKWTLVLAAAALGGSLRVMAAGLVCASAVTLIVGVVLVRSTPGTVHVGLSWPNRDETRRLLSFAGVVQLNDLITTTTPQLVEVLVVRRFGLETLAWFDVALQLSIHLRTAFHALWYPLMPALAGEHARERGTFPRFARASRDALRWLVAATIGIVCAFGPWGIRTWLGSASAVPTGSMVVLVSMGVVLGGLAAAVYEWNAVGSPGWTTLCLALYALVFIGGGAMVAERGVLWVAWTGMLGAAAAWGVAVLGPQPGRRGTHELAAEAGLIGALLLSVWLVSSTTGAGPLLIGVCLMITGFVGVWRVGISLRSAGSRV